MSARASKLRLEEQLRAVLEKEARLDEEVRELLQVLKASGASSSLFHNKTNFCRVT